MSNDDSPGDSLKDIEAFLSGEERADSDKKPEPGFDEMLRSALDTATTEAPTVEDNDAWLDAMLAETEEESTASVEAMYGSSGEATGAAEKAAAETLRPSRGRLDSPLAPRRSRPLRPSPAASRSETKEESLEDAVAAALRSVSMPGGGAAEASAKKKTPELPRRAGGQGPSTRRMMPPVGRGDWDVEEDVEEEAPVPTRSPEAEESAKVKELREQVQQFGRETEQYRERMEEQAKEARTKGRKDVFDRLLPILDTLDIAIQSAPSAKSADKVIAGVEMVYSQLLSELARLGLECIHPEGETFDPSLHEAMQRSETGEVEPGKINKVLRRGFVMNGKLMRAAQVIVEA